MIKKPKGSTAMAKKNRRIFPCVTEGCKFAARYAKDLERHARTHTGKYHNVLSIWNYFEQFMALSLHNL